VHKQSQQLFQFLQQIMSVSDVTGLFRGIIAFAKEAIGLDTSTIMLLSDDKKKLTVCDNIGLPSTIINTFKLTDGQGLSTYAVKTKKPATVLDFATETRFEVPPLVFQEKLHSAISVPMMIDNDPFGALIGHTRNLRRFLEEEIQRYQFIGNIGAIAIRNVQYVQAIRQARDEWQMTFDAVPDMVAILDDERRVLRANRAMIDRVGVPASEITGRRCYEIVHGTDAPPDYCPFTLLLADEGAHRTEITEKRLCGKFAVTVAPLFDFDGKRKGGIHFVRDITEQERMEGELREKKRFLQAIIETEPECVKLLARDGSLLFMNRAGLDMLDADSFEQVKGILVYPLIKEPYRDTFQQINRDAFTGKSGSMEFEMVGLKGRHLWLETRVAPLRDKDNTVSAALAITRDITERKAAESELEVHHTHLEELVAQRTTELTAATHRLQKELAERLALERAMNELEHRECQRIGRDLHDGMGQLLTGMAFKIGALEGIMKKSRSPDIAVVSDLAALVEQAKESLRRLLSGFDLSDYDGSGLSVSLEQLAARTQAMFAIPCLLKVSRRLPVCNGQVIANLVHIVQEAVTNAVKHGHPEHIEIAVAKKKETIVVSVRDNGKGIPPGALASTGKGLKIMKHRASLIDAKLAVRSGPRGGTVVRCAVPMVPEEKA